MIQERYAARYAQSLMNTFGPPKLTLVRGAGAHVWDADGKEYVDLLGGIAVNALGHGHPALVEAVTTQLQTLGHVSNFFASRAADRARREAARAARRRPGQGLLHQLRRRGQRGGVQADPPHRPHPRRRRRGRLPRPHDGRAGADLQGGLPRAVRAAAGRRHVRAVRRRAGARGGGHRPHRGDPARADPGRGRGRGPAGGLPRGRAADRGRARCPALARRDPDRDGPHRAVVRARTASGVPRHRDGGQGAGRRLPDRRLHRARRGRRAAPAGQPRHARSAATRSPAPPRSR